MMGKNIRLDRFLADMEKGSRSEIRQAAKKGRIQVNGKIEKQTDRKIDPDRDQVMLDGKAVQYHTWEYIMLYKPQGVISATEDLHHRTVLDLLDGENRRDLFPVGRLDVDTEGLLLLTNDGELAHRLLSPRKHVDKVYFARVAGQLPKDARERMAAGMMLEDGTPVQPAKLELLKDEEYQNEGEQEIRILLTIQEGKYHQVKRMFEAMGCRVVYLKRLSMGPLVLDETLLPGEYRRLTQEELARLKEGAFQDQKTD